jgi:hypothetical protein
VSVGAVLTGSATSSANGPALVLWIPPAAGALAAAVSVIAAGFIAWQMSNGMPFAWWVAGSVYAGPAWTAKDSWITNIAGVGAVLGIVLTDSSTTLQSVIQPAAAADVTLLFIGFGGAAAAAPVIYGATAKLESQGINDTQGSVWGLLLAGATSLLAVLGEMATMGLLVWTVAASAATRWSVVVALSLGGLAVMVYSVRSLMYFATLPAPRPGHAQAGQPPGTSLPIRRSLLGNRTFSATL